MLKESDSVNDSERQHSSCQMGTECNQNRKVRTGKQGEGGNVQTQAGPLVRMEQQLWVQGLEGLEGSRQRLPMPLQGIWSTGTRVQLQETASQFPTSAAILGLPVCAPSSQQLCGAHGRTSLHTCTACRTASRTARITTLPEVQSYFSQSLELCLLLSIFSIFAFVLLFIFLVCSEVPLCLYTWDHLRTPFLFPLPVFHISSSPNDVVRFLCVYYLFCRGPFHELYILTPISCSCCKSFLQVDYLVLSWLKTARTWMCPLKNLCI